MCCTSLPRHWIPDLRVTVRWLVDKKQDGKTHGCWYKAENVYLARYDGEKAGEVLVIFLPDDRVSVVVVDGHQTEHPADDDPFVVQGVPDDKWNEKYSGSGGSLSLKLFLTYYGGEEGRQQVKNEAAKFRAEDEANKARCNPNYKPKEQ